MHDMSNEYITRSELWYDYMRLMNFATRLLNPDDLGFAVTEEIRDAAREAIGIKKVTDKHMSDVYSEVQRCEFSKGDE
jgi:hypothetical protein